MIKSINKKLVSLSMLLLPVLGFSYELNFSKSFSKTISPDLLTTNINISVESSNENEINKNMEEFNNFLKNTKNITLKNTNYSLTPKYEYKKDETIFKGFIGSNRFSAQSKDANSINLFIAELIALKDKLNSKDIKLDIVNLSWEISEILQTKNIDELRLEALKWIEDYSKELSIKTSKQCEIKDVKIIDEFNYTMPRVRAMSVPKNSVAMDIAPLNSEQDIKINTNFTLDCK